MKPSRRRRSSRAGKFLILGALLLPAMAGGVALSVDYGVLSAGQAQLRTAADAAALAGAMTLADDSRLSNTANLTSLMTHVRTRASLTATSNSVLGQAPVVLDNTANGASGDVVVGYVDPTNPGSTFTTAGSAALYNAVRVNLSRDSTHGGIVPSLFGGVIGRTNPALEIRATALAAQYTVRGFQSMPDRNVNLLPVVLDSTTYNSMISTNGRTATDTTDSYGYDPNNGGVSSTPDGVYESKLYPVSTGSPGNWGTVKIGVSNNSTSTLRSQIEYGITPAQMATYPGGVLQLDPATNTLQLGGNPGISAGISSAFDAIIGRPVFVPIYSQVQGNGNNTRYTITGFGGVRVMAANFKGSPKYVVVQPATVQDPTAIAGTAQNGWTSGGLLRISLVE